MSEGEILQRSQWFVGISLDNRQVENRNAFEIEKHVFAADKPFRNREWFAGRFVNDLPAEDRSPFALFVFNHDVIEANLESRVGWQSTCRYLCLIALIDPWTKLK